METEISNFIMVWCSVFISASYCYAVVKIVPKGIIRFSMFLPVLCMFFILPLKLKSVNLVAPTAFFITWLATFKILLLVYGNGPLSDPSLSIFHFVFITCFPVIPQKESHKNAVSLRSPLHFAKKGLILLFLIGLGLFKHRFPRDMILFLVCLFIYIGLDFLLGVAAIIGQVLLQTKFELAFHDPYLSTSLQDFWSHRWNRVTSTTLRSAVFRPIFGHINKAVGKDCGAGIALLGSFLISAIMHEIIFYYLARTWLARSTTLFFLTHGVLIIVESVVKKKLDGKWQMRQEIIGPIIFAFVIWTFMRMPLQELLEYEVDSRALEEYKAVAVFIKRIRQVY